MSAVKDYCVHHTKRACYFQNITYVLRLRVGTGETSEQLKFKFHIGSSQNVRQMVIVADSK